MRVRWEGFAEAIAHRDPVLLPCLLQIADLEVQCNEVTKEKEKNSHLTAKVKELQSEQQEKEQVWVWHARFWILRRCFSFFFFSPHGYS